MRSFLALGEWTAAALHWARRGEAREKGTPNSVSRIVRGKAERGGTRERRVSALDP